MGKPRETAREGERDCPALLSIQACRRRGAFFSARDRRAWLRTPSAPADRRRMKASGTERSRTASAFTILELMVVLAIVGVLAAIAIPLFHTYQMRSKSAEVASNLAA